MITASSVEPRLSTAKYTWNKNLFRSLYWKPSDQIGLKVWTRFGVYSILNRYSVSLFNFSWLIFYWQNTMNDEKRLSKGKSKIQIRCKCLWKSVGFHIICKKTVGFRRRSDSNSNSDTSLMDSQLNLLHETYLCTYVCSGGRFPGEPRWSVPSEHSCPLVLEENLDPCPKDSYIHTMLHVLFLWSQLIASS